MTWNIVQLKDVFLSLKNGSSIKQGDGLGGVPITRIESIADGYLNHEKLGYANIKIGEYRDSYLKKGDILMSHINSWKHLGKTALIDSDLDIIHGMNLLLLRANQTLIDPRYANYYFSTIGFKSQLYKISNQSVNQSSFAVNKLKELKFPLPPIDIQKQIADTLDKADALRKKDQELLQKYDELAQAIFYDMFESKPNLFDKKTLKSLSLKITDGTHQSPKFISSGIPFLFISNIKDDAINYNTDRFISEEEFIELYKRTPLEQGDILLTTVGSYGNPAVVDGNCKFMFQRHIAYIKPDRNKILPYFQFRQMKSNWFKRQVEDRVRGIAQKTLNLSDLNKIELLVPELGLQKIYEKHELAYRNGRKNILASISYSSTLFNSLVSKYFS